MPRDAPLRTALEVIFATPDRRAVVVDDDGRPVGLLDIESVAGALA